jgi:hypothetical protein
MVSFSGSFKNEKRYPGASVISQCPRSSIVWGSVRSAPLLFLSLHYIFCYSELRNFFPSPSSAFLSILLSFRTFTVGRINSLVYPVDGGMEVKLPLILLGVCRCDHSLLYSTLALFYP